MKVTIAFFVLALMGAMSSLANAECVCSCVNGQVTPICTSSIDVRPICAPRVCLSHRRPCSQFSHP